MKIYNVLFYLVLCVVQLCSANPDEWVVPGDDVQTVYFQGMMQSQRQAGKYCGPQGFVATTGERVIYPGANSLIRNPYIGKELDEVMLGNGSLRAWYHPMRLIDRFQQYGFTRQLQKYGAQVLGTRVGMPTVLTHAVDIFKINLAQERDVREHAQRVALCHQEHGADVSKILWGVSRGAAATLNAHAVNQYSNVKMLVLEGCFDTVAHTVELRSPAVARWLYLHRVFHHVMGLGTEHKVDGISPLSCIEYLPEGVPVVLITSQIDRKVPKACTDIVVQKLTERNKNPVHYLVLEESTHNVYALGEGKDQQAYRRFLHGLYKQYNLPYIPQYAD